MTSLRSRLVGLLLASLFVMVTGPVTASAGPVFGTVGPGWFGTSNTNLDLTIPVNSGTAGARVVSEDRLVVTDQNGLTVYDISDPALPLPLGFVAIPQQYYYTEEDVPSNGEIALVGQFGDLTPAIQLNVVDISLEDNTGGQPTVIGTLADVDEHTFECARDCTYAYGSSGAIVDLTDPTAPALLGDWIDEVAAQVNPATGENYVGRSAHDVTEVAPGILLTSSNPMYLLDVRETPASPQVVGIATFPDNRFIHANLWPYHGALPANPADPAAEGWEPDWSAFDRWILVGGESSPLPSACSEGDASFMTLDWTMSESANGSTYVRGQFDPANGHGDEYKPAPGTFVDGGSPYSQFCAHWFTTQPGEFRDGGLLAMGWYEFGVRFLEVGQDGAITERGWLIPAGGSTSAAYWVDEDTVLTADYQRGVDVLTYDDAIPPSETEVVEHKGVRFERAVLPVPRQFSDWYTGFGCPLPQ